MLGKHNNFYGKKHSEESKNLQIKNHVGMTGKNHNIETKDKISKGNIGVNNGMYNKKHSKASLEKISKSSTGENHNMSKLKESDVLEIRKLCEEGCTQKEISKLYCVGQTSISNIVLRKSWKHL